MLERPGFPKLMHLGMDRVVLHTGSNNCLNRFIKSQRELLSTLRC